MEDIIQDETTQTTVADGEVNTETVTANSSEPTVEEVIEETINTNGSEPVEEVVSASEPVIIDEVKAEIAVEQKPVVELKSVVEALLFITSDPLELDKIQEIVGIEYSGQKLDKKQIREALAELTADYQNRNTALQLVEIANGWQLCTKKEYAVWLEKLAKNKDVYKLSNSALETLSIIAYKQPLTRAEVEHIRGVDSGGVIHNLLEKRLVRITGRKEVLGHPLLYGTSDEFLQYFGLASLADLPMLEDLNKS
ncbi:MAG: SMC-Scp complex subunit ScpB [bacterium]|nr:SMC-Scp complex subunit ScpB [bacterium]MDD5354651.1 SMC-Scp complex subunit ScpB [bacterium]MDD5757154.1 SMC-Scp complex subunit ScpB [bacterium]